VYAGAIMVVFVFVVMLLNFGDQATAQERQWLRPAAWTAPAVLTAVLIAEMAYAFTSTARLANPAPVGPKQVGLALFGPYLLGVELASFLLLAGLVGGYHPGRRLWRPEQKGES